MEMRKFAALTVAEDMVRSTKVAAALLLFCNRPIHEFTAAIGWIQRFNADEPVVQHKPNRTIAAIQDLISVLEQTAMQLRFCLRQVEEAYEIAEAKAE